jgi:hypothetical protein
VAASVFHSTTPRTAALIYSNTYVRKAREALNDPQLGTYERGHYISLAALAACAGVLTEDDTLTAIAVVREWWRQISDRAVS